jgi:hypothetical protein
MIQIPAALLTLGKQILAKAVYTKVTKEFNKVTEANDDGEIIEIVDSLEEAVISKKKVSAWASLVTPLVYFASSQGYIDPAIAELVNSILSNPDTVEAIEGVVE